MDCPIDRIKNKNTTISPSNKKDNKCFQYAATILAHHEEIKEDLQRITNIKPFINKYNCRGQIKPPRIVISETSN